MAVTDRWPELLEAVQGTDDFPAPVIKPHTRDKLHFLHRYIDITTTSMVDNPKWEGGVAYLDLYSGPGIWSSSGGTRIPGSPLIAAMAKKMVSVISCCDLNADNAKACAARLDRFAPSRAHVFQGDSSERLSELLKVIPSKALTITLIDPFSFSLRFEVFERIAAKCRADFIVLFADSMDLNRNLDLYLQSGGRIDQMLGDSDWRKEFDLIDSRSEETVCSFFRDQLRRRLADRLGYAHFEHRGIGSGGRRYYTLLFASQHQLGAKFWRIACSKDAGGQGDLFAPD